MLSPRQSQDERPHHGRIESEKWLEKLARRKIVPVRFLPHSRQGGYHPKIPL